MLAERKAKTGYWPAPPPPRNACLLPLGPLCAVPGASLLTITFSSHGQLNNGHLFNSKQASSVPFLQLSATTPIGNCCVPFLAPPLCCSRAKTQPALRCCVPLPAMGRKGSAMWPLSRGTGRWQEERGLPLAGTLVFVILFSRILLLKHWNLNFEIWIVYLLLLFWFWGCLGFLHLLIFYFWFFFFSSLLRGASKKQALSCSTALNYSDQHFFVHFTLKENHVAIPKWGREEREGSERSFWKKKINLK